MDRHTLHIDPATEVERIVSALHHYVRQVFHRRGALIRVRGGSGRGPSTVLCLLDRTRQATDVHRIGRALLEPSPARFAVHVPHGE